MEIKNMEIKLKAELILDLKENALHPNLFFRLKVEGDKIALLKSIFQTKEFNCKVEKLYEDGLLILKIQPKSE